MWRWGQCGLTRPPRLIATQHPRRALVSAPWCVCVSVPCGCVCVCAPCGCVCCVCLCARSLLLCVCMVTRTLCLCFYPPAELDEEAGQEEKGHNHAIHTVQMRVVNPKSLSMAELYGSFDANTHEWSDGVLAMIVRQFATDTSAELKWTVFDGPVDAVWIEVSCLYCVCMLCVCIFVSVCMCVCIPTLPVFESV